MPILKPHQLEASLHSGKLESLYLFDGPENWLKERAVNQIIERLVPPEMRDFGLERLDGQSCTGGQIVTAMQSLPFLGKRRVVVVQAIDELSATESRVVGESLPQLPTSTCLIFLCDRKANLREEIPAQVGSHGCIVTFWTPFLNQLPSWVISETKRRGKSISMDAATRLAHACANLQQISNELDKLCLFVGPKKSIDAADVRANGLPDKVGDYKDLEEALWSRHLSNALRQGQLLSETGVRGEAVFPVCERIFRTLLLGHHYLSEKKMAWDDMYAALNIRSKTQQSHLMKGLEAYKPAETRRSLGHIVQADYDLKTGALPSPIAVSLLLLKLCG